MNVEEERHVDEEGHERGGRGRDMNLREEVHEAR